MIEVLELVVFFENLWMLGKVFYGFVVRLLKRGVRRFCVLYDIYVVDCSLLIIDFDVIVMFFIVEVIILWSVL